MNVIVRALYNRPEMLALSLEHEYKARKYFPESEESYITLFCIEYGAPEKCIEIVKSYPYKYSAVVRKFRHHGWGNILEGFKMAFNAAEDHVINIEDDNIIHKTYFEYVARSVEVTKGNKNYSAINASNRTSPNRRIDDVNTIKWTTKFEAQACIMGKYFFKKYVEPYATFDYYRHREKIIELINKRGARNYRAKYRIDKGNLFQHVGWDGMVNRLVDIAQYEENLWAVSPQADRGRHIGFYGQNRPGNFPVKYKTFEDRLQFLRESYESLESLEKLDRHYKDYIMFNPKLDSWDGTLILEEE